MQFQKCCRGRGTARSALLLGACVAGLASSARATTYTPSQIRSAYGFNALANTGTGQTIAIIDFGDDPFIASDLTTFDSAFGVAAPPSFSVINENGGTSLPASDPSGYGETTLDVEYAHAIAPGANIVLIETPVIASATLGDITTAANTAAGRGAIVSMSFGFEGGLNTASETSADAAFNHAGVTYVASSGDNATWAYPASSKNVIGVGGTSLTLTGTNTYSSETTWNDSYGSTGGGIDPYEAIPTYQKNAGLSGTNRHVPDVAYDADPATGVYTYTSYPAGYTSSTGYYSSGGTSAGAPQWAGLIALADQLRVAAGLQPLSSTDALNAIYAAYSNPVLYALLFHDVTTGSNGNGIAAGTGYDNVTGVGSPIANMLVPYLAAYVPEPTSFAIAGAGVWVLVRRRRRA